MDPDEALGVVSELDVPPVSARWLRALDEYMTVLDVSDDVAKVVTESGSTYLVNPGAGWCDCPDHDRRGVECKHLKRVRAEQGMAAEDVDAVGDGLSRLVAGIDAEVAALEERIDELRAARRAFQRVDERRDEITPAAVAATAATGGQGGIADD